VDNSKHSAMYAGITAPTGALLATFAIGTTPITTIISLATFPLITIS
jgi:hypothetical protein